MGWFDRKIIATGYRSLESAHKNTTGMGDNSVMLPMMCLRAGLIGKLLSPATVHWSPHTKKYYGHG